MFVKYLNDIPNFELLLDRLSIIENKIMLFHDLHDYSYDYITNTNGVLNYNWINRFVTTEKSFSSDALWCSSSRIRNSNMFLI